MTFRILISILPKLNILVNSSNRAIITDFGSARIVREARETRARPASHPVASVGTVPPTNSQKYRLRFTASKGMPTSTYTCPFPPLPAPRPKLGESPVRTVAFHGLISISAKRSIVFSSSGCFVAVGVDSEHHRDWNLVSPTFGQWHFMD